MIFTQVEDGWQSIDGDYLLQEITDPWSNRPDEVVGWGVRARVYGVSWSLLKECLTLEEARVFAEEDSKLPTFGTDNRCKWCAIDKGYLDDAPQGWFGCRLCDPPRVFREDLSWEDLEAFDDPS